ncbi:MAG: DNA-processing protein DprA [Acidobacteria bacterium]|nr:DNA-processing protein DprA [Acidobacteriota bacterium]
MRAIDPRLLGWLRLARCRFRRTCDPLQAAALGGGAEAFAAREPQRWREAGLPDAAVELLADAALDAQLHEELERVARCGWTMLHLDDPRYPPLLREHIPDPPPVLSVRGDLSALAAHAVAVVGTRVPTDYGLRMAGLLAGPVAARGLVLVSGLAAGIDSAAHRAALAAGGRTLAVMGTGLQSVYPKANRRLAAEIVGHGALVTEFEPWARPIPPNFPQRNRIIAGLSRVVVVVEARKRSGSLITARLANEAGREVLAVPGRWGDPHSTGTLELMRDGVGPALEPRDVFAALPAEVAADLGIALDEEGGPVPEPPSPALARLGPLAAEILGQLPRNDSVHVDELLRGCRGGTDEVLGALFELELAGFAESVAGGRFRRAERVPREAPV